MLQPGKMSNKFNYTEGEKIGECWYIRDDNTRKGKQGQRIAIFLCRCGKEFSCRIDHIKSEIQVSCGCYNEATQRHKNFKHGNYVNRGYYSERNIWNGMKNRCNNSESPAYHHYGGRGIRVCNRWLESFDNFLNDMGNKPKGRYSIDRIDVNKGYFPENCRWANSKTQGRNKRTSRYITIGEETKCLMEWIEIIPCNRTMFYHYKAKGFSDSEAILKSRKKCIN